MSTFHGCPSELLGSKLGLFDCKEIGRDTPKGVVTGAAPGSPGAAVVGGAGRRGGRRRRRRRKMDGRPSIIDDMVFGDCGA